MRDRIAFLFLNLGHLYAHMFLAIFALVVVVLVTEFDRPYAALLPLATPGFVAFGAGALPAGWLADRWSRVGMMVIFFTGIGISSIATGFATSPWEIGAGLFAMGAFASIYHPVGIAMVVEGRENVGRALGVNGVFGNLGFSVAFVVAGAMLDYVNWQAAFIVPGIVSVLTGIGYAAFARRGPVTRKETAKPGAALPSRAELVRIFALIGLTTACVGVMFHAVTISLPKVFEERLPGLELSALGIGSTVSVIFVFAAFTQILVGHLIDRYPIKVIYLTVAGLQIPLYVVAMHLTGIPLLFVVLGFMMLIFGNIPINDTIVARNSTPAVRGRVYALKYVLTLTIGAVAVPLVAWLYAAGGFAGMFVVLAGCAATIVATVLLLMRMPRAAEAPAAAE